MQTLWQAGITWISPLRDSYSRLEAITFNLHANQHTPDRLVFNKENKLGHTDPNLTPVSLGHKIERKNKGKHTKMLMEINQACTTWSCAD